MDDYRELDPARQAHEPERWRNPDPRPADNAPGVPDIGRGMRSTSPESAVTPRLRRRPARGRPTRRVSSS